MESFRKVIVKSNNLLFGKFIQRFGLSSFFSKIDLPRSPFCLEVGCNEGYTLRFIRKYFSPKVLIGIDVDEKSIKVAKKKVLNKKFKNTYLRVADAQNLPFDDEIFDAVFMFATLHHILDWKRAIHEVKRVLKSGGYFIFKEPVARFYKLPLAKYFDHPASLFRESQLQKVLKSNRFKILHWKWRGFYKIFFHASIEVVCKKI